MKPDRRALNVLLAALGIEQRQLAELMGYRAGYVINVLNAHSPATAAFRRAFGQVVAELLLGDHDEPERYPSGPLSDLVRRPAAEAGSKSELYAKIGTTPHQLESRAYLPADVVDHVCCALGVHPSFVYGLGAEEEAVS